MGFEAPLALIALAAAGLPIVAHLLRRQDLPRRPLPTLALLRRAEASSQKRVRLVDLLLLIARVLLVACFALAIAGPFARVALAYGDGSVVSLAIVLDDSMSVVARPEARDAMIDRADAIIESLPEGSEVAVILGGHRARVALSRTDRLEGARRQLADLALSEHRGTDLVGAVARAEGELAGAVHAERRIVVLSDLAAHAHALDVSAPPTVRLSFESVGAPEDNAGIVELVASRDPSDADLASVTVELRASEGLAGREVPIVARAERPAGRELARGTVTLGPRGARTSLRVPLEEGSVRGTVSLEIDDAIDADDQRPLLLRPDAATRVLLVDGDQHAERGRDETRFLSRALDLAPGGRIRRRTVDPDTFATDALSTVDVLILANVAVLDAALTERVSDYVERGGGLLITPGDNFETREAVARYGALLPARPVISPRAEIGGPFGAGDFVPPGGSSGLETVVTTQRLQLDAIDPSAHTWLTFEDGSAALVALRHGAGMIALFATSIDDDWTRMPYHPGYLWFVVELVSRLAPSSAMPDTPFWVGEPVEIREPAQLTRARIVAPDDRAFDLEGDGRTIRFDESAVPGIYRVELATAERALEDRPRLTFAVATDPEESDLSAGPVPETRGAEPTSTRGAVVHRSLRGWLFALVGLLAIAEAALRSRRLRRARGAGGVLKGA